MACVVNDSAKRLALHRSGMCLNVRFLVARPESTSPCGGSDFAIGMKCRGEKGNVAMTRTDLYIAHIKILNYRDMFSLFTKFTLI